jgi:Protein of unknown function (DUF3237)
MKHDEGFDMMSVGASSTIGEPALRKACVIRADIGPAMQFTSVQGHVRAIFPIIGGEARGNGWKGRILPGGSDFAIRQPDGCYAIEARYCLELEDGTPVMVTNAGIMAPQTDGSFKGRTRATLEAPEGPHRGLASAVYFGTALAEPVDDAHVYIELWEAPI